MLGSLLVALVAIAMLVGPAMAQGCDDSQLPRADTTFADCRIRNVVAGVWWTTDATQAEPLLSMMAARVGQSAPQ
jgi:hypothetical protein